MCFKTIPLHNSFENCSWSAEKWLFRGHRNSFLFSYPIHTLPEVIAKIFWGCTGVFSGFVFCLKQCLNSDIHTVQCLLHNSPASPAPLVCSSSLLNYEPQAMLFSYKRRLNVIQILFAFCARPLPICHV